MTRARALVLAALLVGSAMAVAVPATAHQTAYAVDVSVEPAQPASGDNATVSVTVENLLEDGESSRVADVALYNGTGDDADRLDREDANDWIGGGSEESWDLYTQLDETGERELLVEVDLVSQDGQTSNIERPVPVTVVDPHPSLAVSTDPVGPSGSTDLTLTVANGANANVTGLEAEVDSPDLSLSESRRVVSSIAPGGEAEVTFPATDAETGPVTIDADVEYTTAEGEHRTYERTMTAHVESVDNPANVTLTGVRIDQEGQALVVRGSASNPGSTNASGTVIRAGSGEHVAPGEAQSSFFVGDVSGSDFASFEVHSRLTSDINETVDVPIEIEFAVDGNRVTRETTLQYTPTDGSEEPATQSGGVPLGLIGLLVVGALAVVGWRRYR